MAYKDTAYGATTKIGNGILILDLNNGNGAVSAAAKGDWLINPFKLATGHMHLTGAALSTASATIEGTLDPLYGDGGAVTLFTSDPAAGGLLVDNDTGDGGVLMGGWAYIRYNLKTISGTGAAVKFLLSGDPR